MSTDKTTRVVRPFTPVELKQDELDIYIPEFETVFAQPNIRNIAVTGSFGAGKTSVIRSWEKWQNTNCSENKSHNYLYLSLANFKGPDHTDKLTADDEKGGNAIEAMLINQLAQKVPIGKSPLCRFKRTAYGTDTKRARLDWAIALPVFLALVLAISFDIRYFGSFDNMLYAHPILTSMLLLACLSLVGLATYALVKYPLQGFVVRKVKVCGNEIEIAHPEGLSMFDRHIDDILYLFRASGCDVVVFEDLDRFEKLSVFEDLRAVNELLNYNLKAGSQPVRFFYLVKDDMFGARERTKFFDLIIPVIPYVDPSNADGALVGELLEAGLEIAPGFASELSLYIDDMRIIHDIANTSGHIKAVAFDSQGISPSPSDAEKITALATLKALHPQEYAQLQVGEGAVKKALEEFEQSEGKGIGDCKNPLISYLVVNGYIDETYERYISNCHAQSLSSSDKRILALIAQKSEVDPSYEFSYPAKAAAKLAPYRFAQRNARNYSLAHEVLCGTSNESRQRFIQSIQEDHDLRFILSYVNSKYCDQSSVEALYEPLFELFSEVPAAFSEDSPDVRKFCQTLLTRYTQLVKEGVAHAIGRFASTDAGFLHAEVPMDSSVIDLLESIGYMAEDIDVDQADSSLLAAVYERGLYEPNVTLMEKLCAKQHAVGLGTLGEGRLVNRLAEEGEWPARAVVNSQPNAFLTSVLEEYGPHEETETAIAWMTGFSKVIEDDALMERYAANLEGAPVADVSALPTKKARELFVRHERVQPSFSNALKLFVFNGDQISDGVVHLLAQAQSQGGKLTETAAQIEHSQLLLLELARDEGIPEELLSWVARAFCKGGIDLSNDSTPKSSLAVLIEARAISMTAKSLWCIRSYYDELVIPFALSRFKEYIALLKGKDSCLDESEVLRMVNSGMLSNKQRLDLLKCLQEGAVIALDEIKNPSESITGYIVRHFFDLGDLLLLDGLYADAKTNELKDAVVDCCVEHVDSIIERRAPLNTDFLLQVLAASGLLEDQKEALIAINCEDCVEHADSDPAIQRC